MRPPTRCDTADLCIYRLLAASINLYIRLLLLHSCILVAAVCVSVDLLNDSSHPFIFHALAFFCGGITFHIDGCGTWSEKWKVNKIIYFLS